MNKHNIYIASVMLLMLFLECVLRSLGFCNAPVYFADNKFEYLTLPNQAGCRFGNRFLINSHSQRSEELLKKKKKILAIGDSVINGGVLTDQDSLATSILTSTTDFQFLNISAGSWGPDNAAAYLENYGLFDAVQIILVCSSHDSHDNMDFTPVVGVNPSYPNEQYSIAIVELLDRYLLPRIFGEKFVGNELVIKNGIDFNSGFKSINDLAAKRNIKFGIYLHPELSELKSNRYSKQGSEIIDWASKNHIKLIKGIDFDFTEVDYRDNIHLNNSGQRKLAYVLKSCFL